MIILIGGENYSRVSGIWYRVKNFQQFLVVTVATTSKDTQAEIMSDRYLDSGGILEVLVFELEPELV